MIITGIHHATFLSSDLVQSRAFYEGVLGLHPDATRPEMSFEGVWYSVGQQQIHLMLLPSTESNSERPAHGGRDRHVALWVSDWSGLIERFAENGVVYTASQSGRQALFCRDPDGNALEFIST
jgi:catechol 2,3-dioxygenase-like lactoylglutathione lyase family enzyme